MIKVNWENELALARVDQTVNRLVTAPYMPGFQSPPSVGERDVNPTLSQPEARHRLPNIDPHYLALDGQEPAQDIQDPGSLVVAAMCAISFFIGVLVLALVFFWCFLPWLVSSMLVWAGR
jgi:hypothetical protein